MSNLFLIAAEWAAYFGCLAVLAWRAERTTGVDAFHLVVCYVGGVSVLLLIADLESVHPIGGLVVAVAAAAWLDHFGRRLKWGEGPQALLGILLVAALALAAFDWGTSHSPVSLTRGRDAIRLIAYLVAGAATLWLMATGTRKRLLVMRLGVRHRWAAEDRARPLPAASMVDGAVFLACWTPVLVIPLTTTGLLSGTILRDAAIAVLVARVSGERSLLVLLGLAGTLAAMRTTAGFVFLNSAAPPLIEVSLFVALLLWARRRTARSAWEQKLGR